MKNKVFQILSMIAGLGASAPHAQFLRDYNVPNQQKSFPENTKEQRDWNAAVDAKRKAKKANKK